MPAPAKSPKVIKLSSYPLLVSNFLHHLFSYPTNMSHVVEKIEAMKDELAFLPTKEFQVTY